MGCLTDNISISPPAFEKRIKTNDNILQDLNSVNDVKWFFRPLGTAEWRVGQKLEKMSVLCLTN